MQNMDQQKNSLTASFSNNQIRDELVENLFARLKTKSDPLQRSLNQSNPSMASSPTPSAQSTSINMTSSGTGDAAVTSQSQYQPFVRIPPNSTSSRSRKSTSHRKRWPEDEEEHIQEVSKRFKNALDRDNHLSNAIDVTSFRSLDDMLNRLMPFHIWQLHDDSVEDLPEDLPKSEDLVRAAQELMNNYVAYTAKPYTEKPENKKCFETLVAQLLEEASPSQTTQDQGESAQ